MKTISFSTAVVTILLYTTHPCEATSEEPCRQFDERVICGISDTHPSQPPGDQGGDPGGGQGGGGQDALTPVVPGDGEICDMPPTSQIPQECWFPGEDDERPEEIPIEVAPYPVVISEVKKFLTTTGEIGIQPSQNQHTVNMTGVFWSTAERHIVEAPILGRVFQVRFTPINYRFDFGDGSEPIDSPAPGAPYPDKTITHIYLQPGEYTTTLTVTWTGEFSIDGSPFKLIAGHVNTSVQSPPQLVREYHLVHIYPDS